MRANNADELVLDHSIEGTSVVRLAGIDRPEVPGQRNSSSLVGEAAATLSTLIEGRAACLLLSEGRQDRYGRLLAQVHRDDGLWIQGELLRLGLARVHVTADARLLASDMLADRKSSSNIACGLVAGSVVPRAIRRRGRP